MRRRLLISVSTAACALALTLALVNASRKLSSKESQGVRAEIEDIRDRGEPIEPKDLDVLCPIPDAETLRVAEWMRLATLAEPAGQFTDDAKPLPFVGELEVKDDALDNPTATELRQKARDFLRKHEAPLGLAHQLSSRPVPVAFPYKIEDGFDARVPWVQQLRGLNRVLAIECRLRAVEGDIGGSLASWNTMLALGDSLRPRSCGVSCAVVEAVRQEILRLAIAQVQFYINRCQLSDQNLLAIQSNLTGIMPERDVKRVLFGERVIGLVAFQQPEQLFGPGVPKRSPQANLDVHADDCLFFLQTMKRLIATCQLPYAQSRKAAKQHLDEALRSAGRAGPDEEPKFPGSALLLPGAEILSFESAAPTIALREIALTAVACRRFSSTAGRLPDSLTDLVPAYLSAPPRDPFTGDSLKLEKRNTEIIVYSVGKNEVDDGGVNDNNTDIAWAVASMAK